MYTFSMKNSIKKRDYLYALVVLIAKLAMPHGSGGNIIDWLLGLDTLKRYRYWYLVSFQKVASRTVSFLKSTPNDTNHLKLLFIRDCQRS